MSWLFGDSLSGGNHQDPSTRFTRRIDTVLDPLTSILGKNSFYTRGKNKVFDFADRGADEGNRALSSVVSPVDNAIAPYADPLYHTGLGSGLHQFVNNKPGSTLGAILGGGAAAGALGGGSAGAGASGLGSGGTFSGALGESAAVPSFSSAVPSIGGTGYATMGGYSSTPALSSIGGTGTAAFGGGASGGLRFDTKNFAQNFLQRQGQQTAQQGAPPTYRSKLLDDYQPFQQTPADFNPNANKGAPGDQQLMMLIQALRSQNGQ